MCQCHNSMRERGPWNITFTFHSPSLARSVWVWNRREVFQWGHVLQWFPLFLLYLWHWKWRESAHWKTLLHHKKKNQTLQLLNSEKNKRLTLLLQHTARVKCVFCLVGAEKATILTLLFALPGASSPVFQAICVPTYYAGLLLETSENKIKI